MKDNILLNRYGINHLTTRSEFGAVAGSDTGFVTICAACYTTAAGESYSSSLTFVPVFVGT